MKRMLTVPLLTNALNGVFTPQQPAITRLSTMKVHPRLAMELARHSDMRLTMKTYTDAGQLPLREVMDSCRDLVLTPE